MRSGGGATAATTTATAAPWQAPGPRGARRATAGQHRWTPERTRAPGADPAAALPPRPQRDAPPPPGEPNIRRESSAPISIPAPPAPADVRRRRLSSPAAISPPLPAPLFAEQQRAHEDLFGGGGDLEPLIDERHRRPPPAAAVRNTDAGEWAVDDATGLACSPPRSIVLPPAARPAHVFGPFRAEHVRAELPPPRPPVHVPPLFAQPPQQPQQQQQQPPQHVRCTSLGSPRAAPAARDGRWDSELHTLRDILRSPPRDRDTTTATAPPRDRNTTAAPPRPPTGPPALTAPPRPCTPPPPLASPPPSGSAAQDAPCFACRAAARLALSPRGDGEATACEFCPLLRTYARLMEDVRRAGGALDAPLAAAAAELECYVARCRDSDPAVLRRVRSGVLQRLHAVAVAAHALASAAPGVAAAPKPAPEPAADAEAAAVQRHIVISPRRRVTSPPTSPSVSRPPPPLLPAPFIPPPVSPRSLSASPRSLSASSPASPRAAAASAFAARRAATSTSPWREAAAHPVGCTAAAVQH